MMLAIEVEWMPHSEGDPNGVGVTAAGIPLTVDALLAGIVIASTITGRWQRIGAVLGFGAEQRRCRVAAPGS